MVLKCDTTRLLSGRMSRLINFLGNFIIVVVLLHSASLSLPSKKFFLDALFLFSLSLSSIILHILFPNFPFWFPPKGIKGIQVVFELFQFQSLCQPSVFNSTEIEVVLSRREGKKKKKETKNYSPQTTMVNNLSRSLESPSWKKGGKICFNPVGRETQLTVRQFREVSDLGSGEKIGSRKEDERSKPGVQFSPRVPITIHIALPSRIKLLPLPDFHIFTRKRAAFTIPTGSRFMKGLN